jgi:hypothetical protein
MSSPPGSISTRSQVSTRSGGATAQDRTTPPELEHFLADRMHAATVEIDSGHLSLITHPQAIANLILDAAGVRTME